MPTTSVLQRSLELAQLAQRRGAAEAGLHAGRVALQDLRALLDGRGVLLDAQVAEGAVQPAAVRERLARILHLRIRGHKVQLPQGLVVLVQGEHPATLRDEPVAEQLTRVRLIYIYIYIYIYICICVYMCIYVYIYIYMSYHI